MNLLTNNSEIDKETQMSTVPVFMMQSEEQKLDELLEEILSQHRCKQCTRYLCCQGCVFHDANCRSVDLRGFVSWKMIRARFVYRQKVCLK